MNINTATTSAARTARPHLRTAWERKAMQMDLPSPAPAAEAAETTEDLLDLAALDLCALLGVVEALVLSMGDEGDSGIDGELSAELQRLMRMAAHLARALAGRVMPDELPFVLDDAATAEALLAAIAARVAGLKGCGLHVRQLMAYAQWQMVQLIALLRPSA